MHLKPQNLKIKIMFIFKMATCLQFGVTALFICSLIFLNCASVVFISFFSLALCNHLIFLHYLRNQLQGGWKGELSSLLLRIAEQCLVH